MNLTAALIKFSVTNLPCSEVASSSSLTPQTPVVDISFDEVPLPVSSAFNPSARNTLGQWDLLPLLPESYFADE